MRKTSLCSAFAICVATFPATVRADVAPADVWSNFQAYMRALGGELTATLTDEGGTLTAADAVAVFALPMGLGTASVALGSTEFRDNGDGTVTQLYPPDTPITAGFDIVGVGQGHVGLVLRGAGYETLASGTPGDVTYSYQNLDYELEFSDLSLTGPAFEGPDMEIFNSGVISGSVTVNGNSGEMRVTEGDVLAVEMDGAYSDLSYLFSFGPVDDVIVSEEGTGGAGSFAGTMMLPADGVAVMAIPQALRDGLSVQISSETLDTTSFQQGLLDGELVFSQRESIAAMRTELSFDANGLAMEGDGEDYTIEIVGNEFMPFPMRFAAGRLGVGLDLPLLQSGDMQQFALRLGLDRLSMSDELWALFDPEGALPRDPAAVDIGLSGDVRVVTDLLDFTALAEIEQTGEIPVELHGLQIGSLLAAVAGAELTGQGEFSFDNEDLETFGGLPAPTGAADLRLVGGNGLLDKLVALGLVPEDEAMGARMMMGLFARPGAGEDTLETTIEVDGETGAVTANGQRLQ